MVWKRSTNFVPLLLDPENWWCQCAIDGFPIAWRTHQSMWHCWNFKADDSNDSVIYCHEAKYFNSWISWQYLLTWKVHHSDVQQRRIVRRVVLYSYSFSMACTCSWTATVSLSSHIFCSTNALIQPLFWRGGLSQLFWQCCQFPDTLSVC